MNWYKDLIEEASKAIETDGWDSPNTVSEDDLEEFAAEWNKTPAGLKWAEFAASLTWEI